MAHFTPLDSIRSAAPDHPIKAEQSAAPHWLHLREAIMSAIAPVSAHIAVSRISSFTTDILRLLKTWKSTVIPLLGLAAAYAPTDAHGIAILSG